MVNMIRMSIWEYIFEAGNYFFRVDQSDWSVFNDDLSYEETEDDGLNGLMLRFEKQSGEYSKEVQGHFSRFIIMLAQWIGKLFQKAERAEEEQRAPRTITAYEPKDAQSHINHIVRNRLLQKLNEDSDLWMESAYYRRKSQNTGHHGKNTFKRQLPVQAPKSSIHKAFIDSIKPGLELMHGVFKRS